jgi:hypothetical protein
MSDPMTPSIAATPVLSDAQLRRAVLATADRARRLDATSEETLQVLDALGLLDTAWEMRGGAGRPPLVPPPVATAAPIQPGPEVRLCVKGKHRMIAENVAWKTIDGVKRSQGCRLCRNESNRARRKSGSAA